MKYELMIILKPLLPEDIRAGIQKKIEAHVKKAKGTITNIDVWGKRHLAYEIEKHEEGYYLVYTLELDPGHAAKFQNELKLMNDILRFLLTKID
ncbi:MAG: 30S ribosomal protein S6 [Candidatus Dojkabacteria bacterium]|uniref:Small ribosomal subunit protein bS6 n=2 Tax=Candidatus Dojkabacteria TaxID=74243 RepID=A0A136KJK7_9BACT|nr:MAG: 30S ribosomal protein S6 [candidate division WS6 bacterium OLB21]MBW7953242.1 30S ribosomal protein S6 [Candidatus Dojkabacteria bacterium]WKZ28387.1 MAG: 30S ribosomal protein S6 [Candidatus Dojkabacteria bacterium]